MKSLFGMNDERFFLMQEILAFLSREVLCIKLHVTERLESLYEVCEGVAGVNNHVNRCCWDHF